MAETNIDKLIKEREATVADLRKQFVEAQNKLGDLKKIAAARALAAKHGV